MGTKPGSAPTYKYALVLSWGFISFTAAMLCFYNGFFLQRKALPAKSPSCALPATPPYCQFPGMALCTGPPAGGSFQKLILIVIDALRYDFLLEQNENATFAGEFLPTAVRFVKLFLFIFSSEKLEYKYTRRQTCNQLPLQL